VVALGIKSLSYLASKKKLCRHEQINKKPQETLDEHVVRPFERTAGTLIAFACYDSPSLIKRGASLSEGAIENVMTSIFYGDDTKNGADPDLITYVDQFMLGLNKFKGLYTQSLQAEDQMMHLEKLLLSIPEYLHRHKKLLVYAGDGSIEKGDIVAKVVVWDWGEDFRPYTGSNVKGGIMQLQKNDGHCEIKRFTV
jgi:hypothetical protein